ncbi:MAG TPA: ABC transporter permease [Candidatus Saccharimonadaceae bacterium]|jgi:putative ABC transport system permease protein|nr:ABC transporter permease [Candidatus Saccharimonadaceae bacterium]
MSLRDLFSLSVEALLAHRLRYGLSALAVGIGLGAVVAMSSLGEGTRRFIQAQATMFGTSVVAVNPGRVSTMGVPGGAGGSARKLTLDDARALARLPGVISATPYAGGTAEVEFERRGRRVLIMGAGGRAPDVWSMRVAAGRFLPDVEWDRGSAVAVLGPTLKRELFGNVAAVGRQIRIGQARFRVIGVMESKGMMFGFDLDDIAYVPVADALRLFNRPELGEIDLKATSIDDSERLRERARRLMIDRHGGEEDFTVMTQADAMKVIDAIMDVVTGAVTAIAGVSLLVGAIGIFTVLWIVVQERVREVGLIKALGATDAQVLSWYLCEAALTAGVGGTAGLVAGAGGAALLARLVPAIQAYTSPLVVAIALGVSLGVGLLAGVAPAMRAARLDPIEALRTE